MLNSTNKEVEEADKELPVEDMNLPVSSGKRTIEKEDKELGKHLQVLDNLNTNEK